MDISSHEEYAKHMEAERLRLGKADDAPHYCALCGLDVLKQTVEKAQAAIGRQAMEIRDLRMCLEDQMKTSLEIEKQRDDALLEVQSVREECAKIAENNRAKSEDSWGAGCTYAATVIARTIRGSAPGREHEDPEREIDDLKLKLALALCRCGEKDQINLSLHIASCEYSKAFATRRG